MKPKRYRIKKAAITHISLVPRGKNLLKTVFKEADANGKQEVEFATIVKADQEAGELLAVVYAPGMLDTDQEDATAPVIKEFAYQFLRDHRNVDIRHDLKPLPKEQAYVAESFIIAKGDERFTNFKNTEGQVVDVTGGWGVVIKIEDPALRAAYRNGDWAGVSMFGDAVLTPISKEAEAEEDALVQRVCVRLTKAKDLQMSKEELQALLAENTKAVMAEVKKELDARVPVKAAEGEPAKPAVPAKDKPAEIVAPVFKGDVSDRSALKAYEQELVAFRLKKEIAAATEKGDFAEVEKLLAKMTAGAEPEITDAEAKIEKGDSDEVKRVKKELAKVLKASAQRPESDESKDKNETLRKERSDAAKRMAATVNKNRGAVVASA